MNNELSQIIAELESKLVAITQEDKSEYQQVLNNVVELQKELLSASMIGKKNLEQNIKQELQQAELKLFSLKEDKRDLEYAYLYKYIKENYDWFWKDDIYTQTNDKIGF